MAVVSGSGEKCTVKASLGETETEIEVPFSRREKAKLAVHNVESGPLDIPLGELMKGAGAPEVLRRYLGEMMESQCSPPCRA